MVRPRERRTPAVPNARSWQTLLKEENDFKATLPPGIREHHELVKFDIRKKKYVPRRVCLGRACTLRRSRRIIDFLHLWIFDHWRDFRVRTAAPPACSSLTRAFP